MVLFQIASDVHSEFFNLEQKRAGLRGIIGNPVAPYLILAGDIGKADSYEYWRLVTEASVVFKAVFIVAGNHEYYGSVKEETDNFIRRRRLQYNNVHFLEREQDILLDEGIRIVGCTLWTDIPDEMMPTVSSQMNDYRNIRSNIEIRGSGKSELKNKLATPQLMTPRNTRRWHQEDVEYLRRVIEKYPHQPIIVVTHHVPTKWRGINVNKRPEDKISCAYSTEMSHLFKDNVRAWVYGHTHDGCVIERHPSGTLLASNAKGYPDEAMQNPYQKECCIDVLPATMDVLPPPPVNEDLLTALNRVMAYY